MATRPARTLYAFVLTVIGAISGYLYARHSIALAVAHMRTTWGWVCGTGLEIPLYFWTPVGAFAGIMLGIFTSRPIGRLAKHACKLYRRAA